MKRLQYRAAMALATSVTAMAFVGVPAAAQTIDQNSPVANSYMSYFDQSPLVQSFKQDASNITGAGIFLLPDVGTTGTIFIGVYDGLPNTGANLLAGGSVVGTAGSWADAFWSPLSITPGATYYLGFSSADHLGAWGDTSNGYANGQLWVNGGLSSYPDFDYTFRTYAAAAVVPEPATWAFMVMGFGGVGAVLRRSRKKVTVACA